MKPIEFGDYQIVPESQAIILTWPFAQGGLMYIRPRQISVQSDDGRQERLPIRDHTRRLQILMLAYAFISILIMWLLARR